MGLHLFSGWLVSFPPVEGIEGQGKSWMAEQHHMAPLCPGGWANGLHPVLRDKERIWKKEKDIYSQFNLKLVYLSKRVYLLFSPGRLSWYFSPRFFNLFCFMIWEYQRDAEETIRGNVWLGYWERYGNVMPFLPFMILRFIFILDSNMCHIKEGLLASVDNCNCAGTLLSFSRLQTYVNSICIWRQRKGKLFN